jgi:hypothetical protein
MEEWSMHQQIRSVPTASPPDVEKLLQRLYEKGVNLAGAGGSNLEFGGEFAFAVDDDPDDLNLARAKEALDQDPAYAYRVLEVDVDPGLTLCYLTNEPGSLLSCISKIAAENIENGRIIRDMIIGVSTDEGIPVQVYSEEVRTLQSVSPQRGA